MFNQETWAMRFCDVVIMPLARGARAWPAGLHVSDWPRPLAKSTSR